MLTRLKQALVLIIVLSIAVLSSCTFEKRIYRKGYHVESNFFKKKTQNKKQASNTKSKENTREVITAQNDSLSFSEAATLSASNSLEIKPSTFPKPRVNRLYRQINSNYSSKHSNTKIEDTDTKIDVAKEPKNKTFAVLGIISVFILSLITLVSLSILAIPLSWIIFAALVFLTVLAFSIYSAFIKESHTETTNAEEPKNNILATRGFLSIFLLSPISWVLGTIALVQFKKNPDKYKNKWMAIVATVLGFIGTIIIAGLVSAFLTSFWVNIIVLTILTGLALSIYFLFIKKYHIEDSDTKIDVAKEPKNNTFGILGFISTLLFFLAYPLFISWPLGTIALVQFKKNPDKYKNKWMAIVATVLGFIGTTFLALAISDFFLSPFWIGVVVLTLLAGIALSIYFLFIKKYPTETT